MVFPSKISSPQPVPRSLLLGAGVAVPQLQPAFSESSVPPPTAAMLAVLNARMGSSGGGDQVSPDVGSGSDEVSLERALQHARGESAGLRASLERTDRTLAGVRSRLMTQDQELRRVMADSSRHLDRIAQLEAHVASLTAQLAGTGRELVEVKASLATAESERGKASRRSRFFHGRYHRVLQDVDNLDSRLKGHLEELRFANVARREAEDDAREARRDLARLRHESARALERLRSRLGDLLDAHSSRVPSDLYRRLLDRVRAYTARFGPLESALFGEGEADDILSDDAGEEHVEQAGGEGESGGRDVEGGDVLSSVERGESVAAVVQDADMSDVD
ncbi:uncharacterized protein SCHCODRAFT_02497309 [Schizophyllum commune H4-8]|nr:uncharacterized protein SCHCODRAFT_02497309 [Schizophyllum commune H4-8]KAI5895731.1 hypothetical protein SCHCODRAFT_02497309 [Schizophyllum commune H4-8]